MSHIVFAYKFHDSKTCIPLADTDVSDAIKDTSLAWVHMNLNHPETRRWLENELSYLDSFVINALLAQETRPRMMQINDGILLNLRGVNLNEGANPSDMIAIRLWIDKNRIISVQRRQLKSIYDIQEMITHGKILKDSGDFLCLLISKLLHYIAPTIGNLNDVVDTLEEQVITNPQKHLREDIINLRTQAIHYKRYLFPQRDVIIALENVSLTWLTKFHKRKLQEEQDIITRHIEDLESIRDRSHIIKDELANSFNDKLSNNLYVLSVISSIFLPLSFLAGLLGVNLSGIPYHNSQFAFLAFCIFLIIVFFVQIFFFKKKKIF